MKNSGLWNTHEGAQNMKRHKRKSEMIKVETVSQSCRHLDDSLRGREDISVFLKC